MRGRLERLPASGANMPKICQYFPSFFEGFTPIVQEFKTRDELLAVPFVAQFAKDSRFHRYSVAGKTLMAEYENGQRWFVVGTLESVAEASDLGLPKWGPPRTRN